MYWMPKERKKCNSKGVVILYWISFLDQSNYIYLHHQKIKEFVGSNTIVRGFK